MEVIRPPPPVLAAWTLIARSELWRRWSAVSAQPRRLMRTVERRPTPSATEGAIGWTADSPALMRRNNSSSSSWWSSGCSSTGASGASCAPPFRRSTNARAGASERCGEGRQPAQVRGVERADRGAAAGAVAQVWAELEQRLAGRGAGGQRLERRGEALAFDSGLELLVEAHESAPALGDAAVDLGVRPAEPLADLVVGEALGLEHQGACLVALQAPHDLGGALDSLVGLEALLDRPLSYGGHGVEVDVLARRPRPARGGRPATRA